MPTTSLSSNAPSHPWIWFDSGSKNGRPRIERVLFRRCFALAGEVREAAVRVCARLHYRLRVNGVSVGVGPGRSYPECLEADAYDLAPWLRPGANVVEAEVLHWDFATFHRLREAPGFMAAGAVRLGDGGILPLDTPGEWLCRRVAGVDVDAPRLSFAQGPVEILDLRADALSGEDWVPPAMADAGPAGGVLRERTIPALTQQYRPAASITSVAVAEDETFLGARLAYDGGNRDSSFPSRDHSVVFVAWLHSPCKQEVVAGVWWGTYWLNGAPIVPRADGRRMLFQSLSLPLREGWNQLVVVSGIVFGYAELCLVLPQGAGLQAHAAPDRSAPQGGCRTHPQHKEACERLAMALVRGGDAVPGDAWCLVPSGELPPSPLRHVAWSRTVGQPSAAALPLTMARHGRTRVAVDMGEIVLGRFVFDVEAPAGTVLDVTHAEELREGRVPVDKAVTVYGADRWVLPGGRSRVEAFLPRGFRHLELLVGGQRGPVTLHAVGAVEQRYPFVFTGTFACSDETFNRLWAYGRRTLELCGEDVFTDCPWRERTLYGGDLLPEMATNQVLTRDLRLVRRSVEVLLQSFDPAKGWMQSRAPIPRAEPTLYDYPLLTGLAADWYVRSTGDAAFARRAWPVFSALAVTVATWRRPDGVYAPPGAAFIDHRRKEGAGATCAFNAVLVAAYAAWARLGRRVGETEAAAHLERLAAELDQKVVEVFYDSRAGSFRDQPVADGGSGTEGTPPNSWPLLFCPSARRFAPEVLAAIGRSLAGFSPDREPDSVSAYQMYYLLAVLREFGAAALAETAIRRVYAGMVEHPTGTLWEHSHPRQSLVHAWSSGINDYLATAVLGVRMGFGNPDELARVRVAPCADSVRWARGTVPHPLGDVDVDWARDAAGLRVTVRVPEGVPVDVAPCGPLAGLPCRVEVLALR